MFFDQDLYGSVPILKKYQVASGVGSRAGVPLLVPAAAAAGLNISTTTGATDMVGCNLDTTTYSTTQGTGKAAPFGSGSSAERMVTVIINPFAVWAMKLSGGATNDTALASQTVTTASSGGTAVTTAASWTSSIEYADGVTWGYTGANAGLARKITSTSSTAGTVLVPFDYATVVGDVFLRAPYWPMSNTTVQLTTTLDQANAVISVGTGAPFKVIELRLRDGSESPAGNVNSFLLACSNSHALNLA